MLPMNFSDGPFNQTMILIKKKKKKKRRPAKPISHWTQHKRTEQTTATTNVNNIISWLMFYFWIYLSAAVDGHICGLSQQRFGMFAAIVQTHFTCWNNTPETYSTEEKFHALGNPSAKFKLWGPCIHSQHWRRSIGTVEVDWQHQHSCHVAVVSTLTLHSWR